MPDLRVLIIEDSTSDAELAARELRRAGYQLLHQRVDRLEDVHSELRRGDWDVILSDFNLPGFDAFDALQAVNESGKDLPFIVVSGAVGEETAIELMKRGARDFIKKDALSRLAPAISREIEEFANRGRSRRQREALAFLARLGLALAESLDFEMTLKKVTRLAIEQFGGWCAVHLRNEKGGIRYAAVAHSNPEKAGFAQKLQAIYPSRSDAPIGPARVLRTGKPELEKNVSEEPLIASVESVEHLATLKRMGVRSFMCLPLTARGNIFGAITFACDLDSYDDEDLQLAEELASRFALALDNAKLYEQSQKAILARDEFLSIASHELKTPLTTLKLRSQMRLRLMERETGSILSPERLRKMFRDDDRQVNRLAHLVEDMLDISRLHSGNFRIHPKDVDLRAIVQEVIGRLAPLFREAGSEVALEAPFPVVGQWDQYRIEQIVTNLISNATKYGQGRPIRVQVRDEGKKAKLVVQDFGIGIAKENQERIFGQFERAISADEVSGLGLGLFIVKHIVDAHHGTISLQSEPGKGSTFTVELPRKREARESLAEPFRRTSEKRPG